ncbi:methyltransferase domain-containing protein [Candidatus Woesearchaeota archaeon]|nr:methyltransferase domain-containing protein [Candidatus Woesearchaeota archaeon]
MFYLFMLGRDPELALAELEAVLEAKNVKYTVRESTRVLALVEMDTLPSYLIEDLGGTIKIAQVLCHAKDPSDFEYHLSKIQLYTGTENKVHYAITSVQSKYGSFFQSYLLDYFKQQALKGIIRKNITPSQLAERDEFLDFVLYKDMLAKTIAVSSPKSYKKRDLERPAVDYMKTISIRLAKILINLGMVQPGGTILDPFCGSGTLLQEALLKKINVIGADSDVKSIEESKENLAWIQKNYQLKAFFHLHQADARKIGRILPRVKINAVVTEPYLGPFLKRSLNALEARSFLAELQELYTDVLHQVYGMLKPNGKVVMVFPKYRTGSGEIFRIHLPALASETGFHFIKSFPYAYPESKLLREIAIFEKH